MFLPALPCLRRLKQAMVVVLPEGFRSLKRTLARLDPDEKLTISVIYPCFPWFSFDALGLFYESRLDHAVGCWMGTGSLEDACLWVTGVLTPGQPASPCSESVDRDRYCIRLCLAGSLVMALFFSRMKC